MIIINTERLKDLVESSGLSYRQNSQSWIFTCPRCDKHHKLYLRKRDGRFVCWYCKEISNFKGRAEYALTELLGMPIQEIRTRLYGEEHENKTFEELLDIRLVDFFSDDDEVTEDVTADLPTVAWPYDYVPLDDPRAAKGLKYMVEERGVSLEVATAYGLRYSPKARRVGFPVVWQGRMIGYQARAIFKTEWVDEDGEVKKTPKMLSTKGMRRELLLMFGDSLKGSEHAVVCEGPIDAIKAHLCGGTVATMGKAVSNAQIKIIRDSGVKRVYLALDPDAAPEMHRIVTALGDLELFQLLPEPGFKDLGEMTPEAVLRQFHRAPSISPGQIFVHLTL